MVSDRFQATTWGGGGKEWDTKMQFKEKKT